MKRKILLGLMLFAALALTGKLNQSIQKPDSLYLGNRFYLNITSEQDLAEAVIPDTLTKFAVLAAEKMTDRNKPVGLKLTIVPLDTGEHTFPGLYIKSVKPTSDSLKTEAFTLKILEIRAAKDTTLVDIAGTQKLKGELPYWAYYAIAGLLLLALIIVIILLIRKYRKKPEQAIIKAIEPIDSRTNRERAVDALIALKTEKLPEYGEFIVYHFRLSEIMKLYLEAEYGFSANEMTTREIKLHLRKDNDISMTEQRDVINWLEGCDKVKFAKYIPTVQACDEKLDWAMDWLLKKNVTPEPAGTEVSHDA